MANAGANLFLVYSLSMLMSQPTTSIVSKSPRVRSQQQSSQHCQHHQSCVPTGAALEAEWQRVFEQYQQEHPDLANDLLRRIHNQLPENLGIANLSQSNSNIVLTHLV